MWEAPSCTIAVQGCGCPPLGPALKGKDCLGLAPKLARSCALVWLQQGRKHDT